MRSLPARIWSALTSLRGRLIASYVMLALLLLGITTAIFWSVISDYVAQVQVNRLNEAARAASQLAREYDIDQVMAQLQEQYTDLEISFTQTVVLVGVAPKGAPPIPVPNVFAFVGERVTGPDTISLPVIRSGRPMGSLVLKVKPFAVLQTVALQMAILLLAILVLAAAVGWWFSRALSRPIARLTQATAAVAEGDFLQTVAPTGTPELDQLAGQFNLMVTRLNESFRTLASERDLARRFAADAAHELKTPLTALKGFQELATAHPSRNAQLVPAMGRQIERIEQIIFGLNTLARLSEGTGITLEHTDVGDVVRAAEPGYRTLARDHGHELVTEGLETPLYARLDPRLLEMALTNLVTNACKFTEAPGSIALSVERRDAEVVIAVTDNGRGISAEELPHIFERFHRGLDTQQIPGSGLGLSIVRESVTRMGGRIAVDSEPGKGSRFAIYLPLSVQER